MDHFFYFCFINNDCMAELFSLADLKFLPVRGTRLNKQKKGIVFLKNSLE